MDSLMEFVGLAADEHRLAEGCSHHGHGGCSIPAQHCAVCVHCGGSQEHLHAKHAVGRGRCQRRHSSHIQHLSSGIEGSG